MHFSLKIWNLPAPVLLVIFLRRVDHKQYFPDKDWGSFDHPSHSWLRRWPQPSGAYSGLAKSLYIVNKWQL